MKLPVSAEPLPIEGDCHPHLSALIMWPDTDKSSTPLVKGSPDARAAPGLAGSPQSVFPFMKLVIIFITSPMLSEMHLHTSMGLGIAFVQHAMKLASPLLSDDELSMRAGAFGMLSPSWPSKLCSKVCA